MRRVQINGGNLTLMDYCTAGPQFASGGFIADSQLAGHHQRSQQQYLVRNSSVGGWSNGVWNQVFAGVDGRPGRRPSRRPPYTTLATTPASREKPYLYVDADGAWNVFVPDAAHRLGRHDLGRRPDARARSIPLSGLLRRQARRHRRRRSTRSWPGARTCSSPRASTTSAEHR